MVLPERPLDVIRLADTRAIMRLVRHTEPLDELPATADALVGRRATTRRRIVLGALLAAISAVAAILVPLAAWDRDGTMPWFWNGVWIVFPWLFLAPLWAAYLYSLSKDRIDRSLRADYQDQRARAVHSLGRVLDTRCSLGDGGSIVNLVAEIGYGDAVIVIDRLAPGRPPLQTEVPTPGESVHVWTMPDGRVIVQARRERTVGPHN